MIINNEYDIFIAFHNSNSENGSGDEAKKIYDFFSDNGLKCFLFSENNFQLYKANFVKIMQSKLFLLVCNDSISRTRSGELDFKKNYHLYVEMDTFYALTQEEEFDKSSKDAAVLFFSNQKAGEFSKSPEKLHPLFDHRDSFFIVNNETQQEKFKEILDWALERRSLHNAEDISDEIIALMNGRRTDIFRRKIEGVDFRKILSKAISVKCVGISNWAFSLNDGCEKLHKFLNANIPIEMIFLDPDGENAKIRGTEENKDTHGQIMDSFNMIESEIIEKYKDSPEKLQLLSTYTYDMIPRENIILIYTENDAYALVQNYSYNIPGATSPQMILKKGHRGSIAFEHYEKIYQTIRQHSNTKAYPLGGRNEQ